jgi:uncharacterized protein
VDDENKLYAILNGYTQTFDIVNEDVYRVLLQKKDVTHISEQTLDTLIKRGYLTTLTAEEEIELIKRLTDKMRNERKLAKYNFHFILSYDCNFRCIYCYERDVLNNDVHPISTQRITQEQIDKAFDVISEKQEKNQSSRRITLYGGEPFLASNYDMIEYIVEKGKQIGHRFSVISNGYDINHYFDLLQKNHQLFNFQITMDGIEDIHNFQRPHFKNNDSFQKVAENIDYLLKMGIAISLRINTNLVTIKQLEGLLQFFDNKGWYGYKNFVCYLALLRNDIKIDGDSMPYMSQIELIQAYYNKKTEGKINEKVGCQDYGAYRILKNMLLGRNPTYKECFCGAQNGNIIFDPMGNIYSCWDMVGRVEHKIGQYIPFYEIDDSAVWFNQKISDYKCAKCKYSLFCGGGCPIRDVRENGEIKMGNCNQYPQVFKHMIKMLYDEFIKQNYVK